MPAAQLPSWLGAPDPVPPFSFNRAFNRMTPPWYAGEVILCAPCPPEAPSPPQLDPLWALLEATKIACTAKLRPSDCPINRVDPSGLEGTAPDGSPIPDEVQVQEPDEVAGGGSPDPTKAQVKVNVKPSLTSPDVLMINIKMSVEGTQDLIGVGVQASA